MSVSVRFLSGAACVDVCPRVCMCPFAYFFILLNFLLTSEFIKQRSNWKWSKPIGNCKKFEKL